MKKSILFLLFAFVIISCDIIEGDGNVVKQDRGTFKNYDKIIVSGSFDVNITPALSSNDQKVIVTTDKNIQEDIKIYVKNDVLYIEQKNNVNISPTKLIVDIFAPKSIEIKANGSGNIVMNGGGFGNIEIKNNGSGNFQIESSLNSLNLYQSGSGNSILKGSISSNIEIYNSGSGNISILTNLSEVQMTNSGSGNIEAENINSKEVTVNNSGSGNCKVEAIEKLYVIISGSGNVYYKGSPEKIKDITGSGDLFKLK